MRSRRSRRTFARALPRTLGLALVALAQAAPAAHADVVSTFDADTDAWTVAGNGAATNPTFLAAGGHPGGFIRSVDSQGGVTAYWQAPAKFLGDRSDSYGAALSFDLRQSATDGQFDAAGRDVRLVGGGISLSYNTPYNPGTDWTTYSIPLHEVGWTDVTTALPATEQQMRDALAAVTTILIRAEYRSGADTDDLDNVVLGSGSADDRPFGAELVRDINPDLGIGGEGVGSYLTELAAIGQRLYFVADADGPFDPPDGYLADELWRSDGTGPGTVLVREFGSLGTLGLGEPTGLGSIVLFRGAGADGSELWRSDGTAAGTQMVADINPTGDALPRELTRVGGLVFFRASDGVNGFELWRSDGTTAGTAMVADINAGGNSTPSQLTDVGGTLFFQASDGTNGIELWRSDGTTAGTEMVADINATGDSRPQQLANVGGTLLFTASDGVNGFELWRSDGTGAGTQMVADINAGGDANITGITNLSGTALFSATDGVHGREPWRSDGTGAATLMLEDAWPGSASSFPGSFAAIDGIALFSLGDTISGSELWRSDGTTPGTLLVGDLARGSTASSSPFGFAAGPGATYFRASDAAHGSELWRTDGTGPGTALVEDINPAGSSSPSGMVGVGSRLLFAADDGENGIELWRAGLPAAAADPDQIAFGRQLPGTTSAASAVTVGSIGALGLETTAAGIVGADAGEFALQEDGCTGLPAVAPGAQCALEVAFSPTGGGASNAALQVQTNDPAGPLIVPLSGTGDDRVQGARVLARKVQRQRGSRIRLRAQAGAAEDVGAAAKAKAKLDGGPVPLKPDSAAVDASDLEPLVLKASRRNARRIGAALKAGDRVAARIVVTLTDELGNVLRRRLKVRLR